MYGKIHLDIVNILTKAEAMVETENSGVCRGRREEILISRARVV